MQQGPAGRRPLYHTLDAFRGLAALCVMAYHYGPDLTSGNLLPGGYLAVDLFFGLSGFVIAYAYDARMPVIGAWGFLRQRLYRLYPLYLLGSLLGLVFVLIRNVAEPAHHVPIGVLAPVLAKTVLMLPSWTPAIHLFGSFPLDQAAWSLSFEIAVNICYALLFRYLGKPLLMLIVAASGIALIYCVTLHGTLNIGMTPDTLASGAARSSFSFFMGILIFRLRRSAASPLRWQASAALLMALLALFVLTPTGPACEPYALVSAMLLFPLFIHLGSRCPPLPTPLLAGLLNRTAILSYAIYILHVPMREFMDKAVQLALHVDPEQLRPYTGIVYIVLMLLVAQAVVSLYDDPVRAWLVRVASPNRQPPGSPGSLALDPVIRHSPTVPLPEPTPQAHPQDAAGNSSTAPPSGRTAAH